jgi:cell division protein FtsL
MQRMNALIAHLSKQLEETSGQETTMVINGLNEEVLNLRDLMFQDQTELQRLNQDILKFEEQDKIYRKQTTEESQRLNSTITDLNQQIFQYQTELNHLRQEIQCLKESDDSDRLNSSITELNQQ